MIKVESYIKRGNSFPIIVNDNGEMYFVKLRAGMSGKYALLNEWIGNRVGASLSIRTQIPIWFKLDHGIEIEDIYIEVKELIEKSFGLNIGFDFKKDAKEVHLSELNEFDRKDLIKIFLFDLMMINIDRTSTNMNLMKVDKEVFSIDYESSLLVQSILEEKSLLENSRILQCLRNNSLYQDIEERVIDEFIEDIQETSMDEILAEIPEKVLDKKTKELLIQGIEKRKQKNWFLKETLYKLKNIKSESQEEERARNKRNQATFKRSFIK